MFCEHCGAELTALANFCAKCGAKDATHSTPDSSQSSASEQQGNVIDSVPVVRPAETLPEPDEEITRARLFAAVKHERHRTHQKGAVVPSSSTKHERHRPYQERAAVPPSSTHSPVGRIVGGVFVALCLAWVGVSPWVTMWRLQNALETRNVQTVSALVNWDAVRSSMQEDVRARLTGAVSAQTNASDGFWGGLVSGMIGTGTASVVDSLVTPENTVRLYHGEAPRIGGGLGTTLLGVLFNANDAVQLGARLTSRLDSNAHYESWREFAVDFAMLGPERGLPPAERARVPIATLLLGRSGLGWQVIGVRLTQDLAAVTAPLESSDPREPASSTPTQRPTAPDRQPSPAAAPPPPTARRDAVSNQARCNAAIQAAPPRRSGVADGQLLQVEAWTGRQTLALDITVLDGAVTDVSMLPQNGTVDPNVYAAVMREARTWVFSPVPQGAGCPAILTQTVDVIGMAPAAPLPTIDNSATPPPTEPVRVGGNIKPPTQTKRVNPVYPSIAQTARIQGVVIIEATIGTDGTVQNMRILRGIPLLDDAALDAVRQWEFSPTLLDGVPVPVIMTVTVNFQLS